MAQSRNRGYIRPPVAACAVARLDALRRAGCRRIYSEVGGKVMPQRRGRARLFAAADCAGADLLALHSAACRAALCPCAVAVRLLWQRSCIRPRIAARAVA